MIKLKNRFKKGMALLLVAFMVVTVLPYGFKVKAKGIYKLNIDNGDITFSSQGCSYYEKAGDTELKLINRSEFSNSIFEICGSDQTGHTITVAEGNVNIQLEAINISSNDGAPIRVDKGCDVNISLCGDNYMKGTTEPGIEVDNGGSITIGAYSGEDSLTAIGGKSSAGIGEGYYSGVIGKSGIGKITINSGKITAKGDYDVNFSGGAGIGTCGYENSCGASIFINGGTIIAEGGKEGAGIGSGGYCNNNSSVCIRGGIITANGGQCGAGIGNGYRSSGGNVTISGGSVYSHGGDYSSDIGKSYKGGDCQVYINGGSINVNSVSPTPCISSTDSRSVYKTTVTLPSGTNTRVDSLDIKQEDKSLSYGGADPNNPTKNMNMSVDSSNNNSRKLFLWLPKDSSTTQVSFTLGGKESYGNFHGVVDTSGGSTLKLDQPKFTVQSLLDSYTYPETVCPSVVPASGFTVAASYTGRAETSYNSSNPPTDVGKYTFTAKSNGNDTYYDYVYSKDFEIVPNTSRLQIAEIPKQVYVGKSVTPDLTVKDGDITLTSGTDYNASYSNNNAAGTANVSVTGIGKYKGYIANTTFDIISLQSIEIIGNTAIVSGDSTNPTAIAHYSDSSTKDVTSLATWTSSNPSVATVDSSGNVTGKKAGTVTISAVVADGSSITGSIQITVSNPFKSVTDIKGVPTTAVSGIPLTLTGNPDPIDATNQTITWSLKDAGTTEASILGNVLSMVSAGKVTVTATIANGISQGTDFKKDFDIIVTIPTPTVTSVTVSPSTATVTTGATQQFGAVVNGENSPSQDVDWSVNGNSSSNTKISSSGILTIGADETATTLTIKGTSVLDKTKSSTAVVTVKKIEKCAITFDSQGGSPCSNITADYNTKINAPDVIPTKKGYDFAGWYKDQDYKTLWNFDNDTVTGDVTIYAKWNPVLVQSVAIQNIGNVSVGKTVKLSALILPSDALNSSVAWNVTNKTGEATIKPSTGELTAIKAGTVTVTATANDSSQKSCSMDITIVDKSTAVVSVIGSKTSVEYGETAAFTARVTSTDTKPITGTIQFYMDSVTDSNKIGSPVTLSNGSASITLDKSILKYSANPYKVLAVYSGDSNYENAEDDAGASITVNKKIVTIKAEDDCIYIGDAFPKSFKYTVTGLLSGDELVVKPTLKLDKNADNYRSGSYTIYITGADAGDNYTINMANGTFRVIQPYVPPIPTPQPEHPDTTRTIPVVSGDGTSDKNQTKIPITQTTDNSGNRTDNIQLDSSIAADAAAKAKNSNSKEVTINDNDSQQNNADKVEITVPNTSVAQLNNNSTGLNITTTQADVRLPSETINNLKDNNIKVDIYEQKDTQKVQQEHTLIAQLMSGAQAVAVPLCIETNYCEKTQIIIPLNKDNLPKSKDELSKYLSSLAVFIDHSDGEKVIDKGEIIYDSNGNPVGVGVWINKFSTFTLISCGQDKFNGKEIVSSKAFSPDKQFTIDFNNSINAKSITNDSIYVEDSNGNRVNVSLSYNNDKNQVIVTPIDSYTPGTYTMYITQNVSSSKNKPLMQAVKYIFTINP